MDTHETKKYNVRKEEHSQTQFKGFSRNSARVNVTTRIPYSVWRRIIGNDLSNKSPPDMAIGKNWHERMMVAHNTPKHWKPSDRDQATTNQNVGPPRIESATKRYIPLMINAQQGTKSAGKTFSFRKYQHGNSQLATTLALNTKWLNHLRIVANNLMNVDDEVTADVWHQTSLTENDEILSPKACRNDTYLLIIVISNARYFERRAGMRNSTNIGTYRGKGVRLVFLTGRTDDPKINAELRSESATYRDIIQANFMDSYRNLTLKTV
jgi:hypothetical protein